jgi:hypothetical protein
MVIHNCRPRNVFPRSDLSTMGTLLQGFTHFKDISHDVVEALLVAIAKLLSDSFPMRASTSHADLPSRNVIITHIRRTRSSLGFSQLKSSLMSGNTPVQRRISNSFAHMLKHDPTSDIRCAGWCRVRLGVPKISGPADTVPASLAFGRVRGVARTRACDDDVIVTGRQILDSVLSSSPPTFFSPFQSQVF